MRALADVLVGAAVLCVLAAVGLRFLSADMGFNIGASSVTPLFLWRGAIGFLMFATVIFLRQIRDRA